MLPTSKLDPLAFTSAAMSLSSRPR